MLSWYRNIKEILKNEPETSLNYLKGQKTYCLPQQYWVEPRFNGLAFQFLKVPYQLLCLTKPPFSKRHSKSEKCDFYVFASTNNQLNSVESTVNSLREHEEAVCVTTFKKLLPKNSIQNEYNLFYFSTSDTVKALILSFLKAPSLYKKLNKVHPRANHIWFAEFCSTYSYLVYFERVLKEKTPKLIITANDHSIQNRCLLAVAHKLGIKTAYMQHASVSELFPALRVNYAFLDGQSALDIYRTCEKNLVNIHSNLPSPKIFLSGQKKKVVTNNRTKCLNGNTVGIAVNALDELDDILEIARSFSKKNINFILRWHPAQNRKDIAQIREFMSESQVAKISDPKLESIDVFLGKINWLVASNSSIHLEAALADVGTIYYEISPTTIPDYYGYVKSGLAYQANSLADIYNIIYNKSFKTEEVFKAIRYYSATYGSKWEGNEGDLVAKCLIALKNNTNTPIPYLFI